MEETTNRRYDHVAEAPAMDMSWDYWAKEGDLRTQEHAVRVVTLDDGRVYTHFARHYTARELAAIAEFERIHDC